MPKGVVAVAESGLREPADLRRLERAGYHAFLVGERLIAQPDPGAALAALRGVDRASGAGRGPSERSDNDPRQDLRHHHASRTRVLAVELGASAIGLVFWPRSPRVVEIERAQDIVAALPPFVGAVGVFVNQAEDARARGA